MGDKGFARAVLNPCHTLSMSIPFVPMGGTFIVNSAVSLAHGLDP